MLVTQDYFTNASTISYYLETLVLLPIGLRRALNQSLQYHSNRFELIAKTSLLFRDVQMMIISFNLNSCHEKRLEKKTFSKP